ncbi:MAG: arylesterase, partial [Alphaproteobacteria bacterium]
ACGDKTATPTSAPAAAASQDASRDANVTDTRPVIVMLGDSLTAGYQLPPGNALPAAIQRDLDAKGIKAKMVNAGVSGDTTADGLNRYNFSVTGSDAKLLVVALGANDFLNQFPAETPKKNLSAILDMAKAEHLPVALLGVALPAGAGPSDGREAAYAAIYPDLAKTYGVPYFPNMLDAIAGKPQLIQQDGVHPTADGVEAMAAEITGFLAPLVPPSTPKG